MSHHEERPEKSWVSSFSLYLEVFAKFTRGIMRGIKQMSLLVFYLEVLAALYFERGLLNMSVPWRFEYVDTSYELEPENSTEEALCTKHYGESFEYLAKV